MGKAIEPGGATTTKKPRRKGKRAKRSALGARLSAAKGSLLAMGVFVGEVAGSSAVASAAKGYLGDRMELWKGQPLSDARLVAAAVGVGLKAMGKTGGYDTHITNVTTGILSSWLSERAFDFGARKAAEGAPAAEAPAGGLAVIGNVYDEAGLFGSSPEKRLERKLAKLKKKADKKGVDWSEVRDADKSKKAMKIMSDLGSNDEADDGDGPGYGGAPRAPVYAPGYGAPVAAAPVLVAPRRRFVGGPGIRRPFFRRRIR